MLSRRYVVERGDAKYDIVDESELVFAEEKERDEFVAALLVCCRIPSP